MKTKELLDKYKKILCPILECEDGDLRFFIGNSTVDPGHLNPGNRYLYTLDQLLEKGTVKEIKELEYFEPEKDEKGEETEVMIRFTRWNDWSEGKFTVICKNKVVSSFELYKLPHCCAILVSCKAFVYEEFRNKRIGTVLNDLRQDIGRLLGYSSLLCTDIEKNEYQRKLLKTNGWKDIYNVINKRTNNRVYISVINL